MSILSIIPAKSDQQIGSIYDPDALHEFADRLHSRASSVVLERVVTYGLLAFVIGFSFGLVAGRQAFQDIPNLDLTSTALVIGAFASVIGIVMGIVKGREKSSDLRLEAQKILLQMKVEENLLRLVRESPE